MHSYLFGNIPFLFTSNRWDTSIIKMLSSTGLALFSATSLASLTLARSRRGIKTSVMSLEKLTSESFPSISNSQSIRNYWSQRDGEHAWLEDVLGEPALDYVRSQNAKALTKLGDRELFKLENM